MYKVYKDNNPALKSITKKSVANCIKQSMGNFPNKMLIKQAQIEIYDLKVVM
jgi:hypothetical protein